MSTSTTLITADEFASMSFDIPTELVEGEIVEMTSPGGVHGKICARICYFLESWANPKGRFEVLTNDSGVLTGRDPDTVRGPDVLLISRDRLPGGKIPRGHLTVPPDVAIEVKSPPSDRWPEILRKISEFLAMGVSEVWVIDPDRFRVHAFHVDDEPTIFNRGDQLTSVYLPEFQCGLEDLFRGIE